jgi:hypothetical protein
MRLGLGNTLVNGGGPSNADGLSLDLNFAVDKTLTARTGPTPVFTRGDATATFIGSDGLIQTAGVDVARFDHDPTTLACKGLLMEEQRTNLVFPSATLTTQTRTVTATPHTLSFYGIGQVVLSGVTGPTTVTGTGAYPTRTTLTFTPTAGSLILTVTGSVTFAQLEVGSFPTSYIPTTSAPVLRSADVCSITGSAFTSFWNRFAGTCIIGVGSSLAPNARFVSNNGAGRVLEIYATPSIYFLEANDTPLQELRVVSSPTYPLEIALAYAINDYQSAYNGLLSVSDTNTGGTILDPTELHIGNLFGSTAHLTGHIQYIRYYRKRLSNSKLQSRAAPSAAPIGAGWLEPAVLVSSTNNNSIVSIEGVFKEARRYGPAAAPLTINSVTFTHSTYGTGFSSDLLFSAVGSSTVDMRSLLRSLSFDIPNDAVPLTGFTVGKTYMLQWFFADERADYGVPTRTQTISIAGFSKTFPAQLLGKAMKCYFVASATNLTLRVGANGELESGHIAAFQIRQID